MSKVYMKMKDLALAGNIIDNGWIENLRYESGKPHMNAIMILSEIVYWYRPTEVRNEYTGQVEGYKKKFKADKLQKNYKQLGERFNLSRTQVKAACDFLKDKGIIIVEFREIDTFQGRLNNVMFVEPVFENLKSITGINRIAPDDDDHDDDDDDDGGFTPINKNTPSSFQNDHPPILKSPPSSFQNDHPPHFKMGTYTKNTAEIITEIITTTNSDIQNKDIQSKDVQKIDVVVEKIKESISKEKIKKVQDKIQDKIKTKISSKTVEKLLNCGENKVNTYINNWDKFNTTSKTNKIGFFVKAVQEGYSIPESEKAQINNNCIPQHVNFDQREYTEADFEKFYYQVEDSK